MGRLSVPAQGVRHSASESPSAKAPRPAAPSSIRSANRSARLFILPPMFFLVFDLFAGQLAQGLTPMPHLVPQNTAPCAMWDWTFVGGENIYDAKNFNRSHMRTSSG